MKVSGIIRGYKVGKELIELCKEMKNQGIERFDNIDSNPEYARKFNGIARKVNVIRENGSLCTKFGMNYVASGLNPIQYYDGIFVYKMREGIPETVF